jgi:hypothetical protein
VGIGDAVMASGRARTLHERTGKRVLIVGVSGRIQQSEVWDGNPRIARREHGDEVRLIDCPATRPYIKRKDVARYTWQRWDIRPGEIYLTDAERAFAEPYRRRVVIEPNTKVPGGNKAWLPDRWQEVADRAGVEFVQTGFGPVRLRGVQRVETAFRQAAAILSVARAYVGTEGALHHVAAAFNVPAVVLWSEFVAPEFTGYTTQRNIRHAGPACGMRVPCAGCRASMAAISVDEVLDNLKGIL